MKETSGATKADFSAVKEKIAYLGSSATMALMLSEAPNLELISVFCDSGRVEKSLEDFSERHEIPLYRIDRDSDIDAAPEKPDFFVIYSTGIIIHRPLLEKFDFYNFHPGDMITNRGRHPLVWNILLGEKEAYLSLHKIAVTLDEGLLIGRCQIEIQPDDTVATLSQRLECGVPNLLAQLRSYRLGLISGQPLSGGTYRPQIQPGDYTINLQSDTPERIRRKIACQKTYSGAILLYAGQRYHCLGFEEVHPSQQGDISNGEFVEISISNLRYRFYISTQADKRPQNVAGT